MPATSYIVLDEGDKVFPVSFPVAEDDIAVFVNGLRIGADCYDFDQLTNSITIKSDLQEDDNVQIRLVNDK